MKFSYYDQDSINGSKFQLYLGVALLLLPFAYVVLVLLFPSEEDPFDFFKITTISYFANMATGGLFIYQYKTAKKNSAFFIQLTDEALEIYIEKVNTVINFKTLTDWTVNGLNHTFTLPTKEIELTTKPMSTADRRVLLTELKKRITTTN